MELPIPNKVKKLWDAWHLRGLIVLSLFLQALLVSFASRRQRSKSSFLLLLIWSAYLLADWVAAVAIGVIINKQTDLCDMPNTGDDLLAFWASFLLLHLGGPDSITSYALEDNEFWFRHLLGLFLQGMAAAYSLYLTLPTDKFLLPTILVLVVGIFKYGERTYALYLASLDHIGVAASTDSSLRSSPQNMSTEARRTMGQNIIVGAPDDQVQEAASSDATVTPAHEVLRLPDLKHLNSVQQLEVAYKLIGHFKGLIADGYVSSEVRASSRKTFLEANHTSAFKVIEYELSILYEVLHTKVIAAVRTIGFAFRFISFCFILGASLLFSLADKRGDDLDKFDIGITYALLIAAIVLDCASFVQLLSSDWTLGGHKGSWRRYIPSIIVNRRRWSESVFQYNMISYCLDESPMRVIYKLAGYFHAKGTIDKLKTALFSSSAKVTEDVKAFVFEELKTRTENAQDIKEAAIMVGLQKGQYTLISYNSCIELQWSVKRFQYPETLLLWHIATELCYHKEMDKLIISTKTKRICKLVSDYMFYLLVMQPSMFSPVLGNWNVVFQDTCAEAKWFFDKHKISSSRDDHLKACEKILSVPTSNKFAFAVKGFKSKSLLFDACVLAKELQRLGDHKWEVMDRMWVELMTYAAQNSLAIIHAPQLGKGGELWTFTWLLMIHLGLVLQFANLLEN